MTIALLIIASVLAFGIGLHFGMRALRCPHEYWTYLLIGLIATAPLSIAGYTWYEELFALGFVLAAIPRRLAVRRSAASILFAVFCLYMAIEAVRGVIFFSAFGFDQAAQKIRWIIFIVLIVVFFDAARKKEALGPNERLPYQLTVAGLVFHITYLCFGLASILIAGSIDFTQYAMISDVYRVGTSPLLAVFGSTQYVVCIYFIVIPAALIVVRTGTASQRNVAWLTLAIGLAAQILYNSRSGMLVNLALIGIFVLRNINSRRVLAGLSIFLPLLVLGLLLQVFFNETGLAVIVEDIANTLHLGDPSRYDVDLQDIDRRVWNFSAVLALSDNPQNAVFGWGLRTNGHVVAPYVYDLFLQARGTAVLEDDVATPGFAAFAVDTGLVGLLLLFSLWVSLVFRLLKRGLVSHPAFILAPTAFVLQLFVANIFDVLLLYLAIMPNGIYDVLYRSAGYPIAPDHRLGQKS